MANEEFNIRQKRKDDRPHKGSVYIICAMILILTVLLDIYFISELIG